jgi:hypothetical protein
MYGIFIRRMRDYGLLLNSTIYRQFSFFKQVPHGGGRLICTDETNFRKAACSVIYCLKAFVFFSSETKRHCCGWEHVAMAKSGDKKRIQENLSFLSKFRIGLIVSNVRTSFVILLDLYLVT